jgi:hypothetical protein
MRAFELNILLLRKYGWFEYDFPYKYYANFLLEKAVTNYYFYNKNYNIVYFFEGNGVVFLISELGKSKHKTKQNKRKEYKFIIFKDEEINVIDIDSNIKLLKLIVEHNACNESYARHFKLNKLLK